MKETFLGLLRSAVTSEQAADMLREFIADSIVGRLAAAARGSGPGRGAVPGRHGRHPDAWPGPDQVRARAGAADGGQRDELAAAIGPTLDRYLTGDLG